MGKLFSALSEYDKTMIQDYITHYSETDSGDTPDRSDRADLSYILRFWDKAKEHFYNMFGEQFIIKQDYTFNLSNAIMEDRLLKKTSWCDLINKIHNTMGEHPEVKYYGDSYHDIYPSRFFYFNDSECIANKANHDYCFEVNGKKIIFQTGTKYMKMLGKMCQWLNLEEVFETFRIEHSMIKNNATQHGSLCLSIHPLDFMTMSDNDSNWSSCMSWGSHGCYRMGTVEMMNSPTVVIAYLESSDTMILWGNDQEWNNKKWRQLFVINEHVITPVKPYPYFDDDLTKKCLEWLNTLTGNQYSTENYTFENGQNRCSNAYRMAAETGKMYNDFSSCQHITKIKLPVPEKREGKVIVWRFNYSGPSECVWCGYSGDELSEDSLYCWNCMPEGDWVYCAECGERIDIDNDDYFYDERSGEYFCTDCRDNYFSFDEVYEEYIPNDDAVQVFLAKTRNEPDSSDDISIITDKYAFGNNCRYDCLHYDEKENIYYFNADEIPHMIMLTYFSSLSSLLKYLDKSSYYGLSVANPNYNRWGRSESECEYIAI